MCGNGQGGGLGNSTFNNNAQGTPVRAKNVSGLMECKHVASSQTHNSPQKKRNSDCIHMYFLSDLSRQRKDQKPPTNPPLLRLNLPTGHVVLTLDTQSQSNPGGAGRDIVVWGKNYESELGNGKKASVSVPTVLNKPDGERFMLVQRKAKEVRDLKGKVWKRGVQVEQCAVAGYEGSVVYWKIR